MSTGPEREPLDALFDAIRREPVPDRPPDAELLALLAAGPSPAAEPGSHSRRRMMMRVATWSLAASVLAAVGATVLFTGSPNVALGDVIKAAEKHKLLKFNYFVVVTADLPPGVTIDPNLLQGSPVVKVIYSDLRAARYRDVTPETVRGLPWYGYRVVDRTKNRRLIVYKNQPLDGTGAEEKGAILSTISSDELFANSNRTTLEHLRDLETHKDAKVTNEDNSIRYTVVDGKQTTTLWVDTATKLPVRMVFEVDQPAAGVARVRIEFTDFEWDPELKEFKSLDDLFSLTPPEGYKLDDQTKEPPEKAPVPAPTPKKP
jgi:hypothetical protein